MPPMKSLRIKKTKQGTLKSFSNQLFTFKRTNLKSLIAPVLPQSSETICPVLNNQGLLNR